jgi:hypothetical protein
MKMAEFIRHQQQHFKLLLLCDVNQMQTLAYFAAT